MSASARAIEISSVSVMILTTKITTQSSSQALAQGLRESGPLIRDKISGEDEMTEANAYAAQRKVRQNKNDCGCCTANKLVADKELQANAY